MGKQQLSISSLDVVDQILALAERRGFAGSLGKVTIQSREGALTQTGVRLVLA